MKNTIKFKIIDPVEVALANKDKRRTKKERQLIAKAIENVKTIIELNEKVANSYFWSNNGNAYSRARREEELSYSCKFNLNYVNFSLKQNVEMSRQNVYVYKTYIINEEETNIRKVKTLKEELENLLRIFEEPRKNEVYLTRAQKAFIEEQQEETLAAA